MGTVDDLLAQSVGTRPTGTSQCWAQKLEGTAADYLKALEAEPVRDIFQKAVVEILDSLGYQVKAGQVGAHLRRECKCRE